MLPPDRNDIVAQVEAVLANLDFREKGGYTREIVEVHPVALSGGAPDMAQDVGTSGRGVGSSSSGGGTVRALLYTATPENPGFRKDALSNAEGAAATIASAQGPSGANLEYLLELAAFLQACGNHQPANILPPRCQNRTCPSEVLASSVFIALLCSRDDLVMTATQAP